MQGLGGSGRYGRGLVERVGEEHTVVAPDLAGFGSSDRPADDVDRSLLLADLDAVVDAQAAGEALQVVGHSLGSVLAALWTSRHAHHVGSLGDGVAAVPRRFGHDYRTRADLRPSAGWRIRVLAHAVRHVLDESGHQFLLRTGFEPFAG